MMDTTATIKILLVEDDLNDTGLLRAMFSKETPGSFRLTQVARMCDAEVYLKTSRVDLILLDLGLPDVQGLETLRRARVAAPGVPIIVLSGLDDEGMARAAIKEGAQDYLIKGQVESRALPRALRHTIDFQRMLAETNLSRQGHLQLRDDFLSHVSHELRGPLTCIYSFTTIIADGLAGETTPRQDAYLHSIYCNVVQLQGMIEQLLEATSPGALPPGVASPREFKATEMSAAGHDFEAWTPPPADFLSLALPPASGLNSEQSSFHVNAIQGRWVSKIGGVF